MRMLLVTEYTNNTKVGRYKRFQPITRTAVQYIVPPTSSLLDFELLKIQREQSVSECTEYSEN